MPNPNQTGFDNKEILSEAVEQAKQAGTTLARRAGETAREAKTEARKHIEQQKGEVVRQISGVNEAIRQTAESVENPTLERQMMKLAEQVERAADSLDQAELEDVVVAAENFSRSQPLIFLTGSFLAGLMLARFLRAHTPTPQYTQADAILPPPEPRIEVTPHDSLVNR